MSGSTKGTHTTLIKTRPQNQEHTLHIRRQVNLRQIHLPLAGDTFPVILPIFLIALLAVTVLLQQLKLGIFIGIWKCTFSCSYN